MNRHIPNRSSRCEHLTRSGRRCRLTAPAGSKSCVRHAAIPQNPDQDDLTAMLTSGLEKFDSPAAINQFLSRLLLLLAQDRISPRRAAVLAYITNQILRTVSAMELEAAAKDSAKPTITWNLPGPPRERESHQGDQVPCP
jgi:hypothetical protein